ncbi:DEAD/DEAH box helicase [Rossellomorea vietnamensis]|uniref:DEAD/DEAH box helicase n=1 Tax=Rossellomorea vietnamensis TaxID=218284 RepID=A0A5D4KFL0_9BACI|nr:DEAD/DEAH box helicase [Rossellomorea vietnamensis]TYR75043.1 DEAD/DEAH box helicase [Rossellomorea vietnamensis]
MNINLNTKIIKDKCGSVSFKRGETYFKNNAVEIIEDHTDACKAVVKSTEDFHVTISSDLNGEIHTECTCPKLSSFALECQHVAAVLIALKDRQRGKQDLTEGFLTLFENKIKSSGRQRHFDTRRVMEAEFTLKPVRTADGQSLFSLKLMINRQWIKDIRTFLHRVRNGQTYQVSRDFIYDPQFYCFLRETNEVITQLIKVVHDEKVYQEEHSSVQETKELLLIPPSSWQPLQPLLQEAGNILIDDAGQLFKGLQIAKEPLPLQFTFDDDEGDYYLKVRGLQWMVVLLPYNSVLCEGKLYHLPPEDCRRLAEIKDMLESSGTSKIPIPSSRIAYFLEKVAVDLKRLGKVEISGSLRKKYMTTPLVAKLYLDRVKNRLLAGLEFQYENIVINPLEDKEIPTGNMLVRDTAKEKEILSLMEESSFAKTEGGYILHNEELEYEFLYYMVPKLKKLAGIYATTAVRSRIFRGKSSPKIRVKIKRDRMNWLEFKFEMDGIPEREIHELLSSLQEQRKYYRLQNGSLLSLESKEIQEIQRFLRNSQADHIDFAKGLALPMDQCLELLDYIDSSEVFKIEKSFRELIESLRQPGSFTFDTPDNLSFILRDYQKEGYQWMKTLAHYGFGGVLADDMGLGKTLQSIAFIQSILPAIREQESPALIVCPSSLTYNWLAEFQKFTPAIKAVVMDGNKKQRQSLQKNFRERDVIIISYPLLKMDISWFEKQAFSVVFFDEAQNFKNPVTQTARAVKKIDAAHRFALSGTPIENSIEELWSIYHVVFPQLFKGLMDYSHLTRKTIARRIKPFMLRRLKEDVLSELPAKMEMRESIELLPQQKKLYAAYLAKLKHDTLKHLDKDTLRKNKIKILAGITRLRQICCHPSLFVEGYKGDSAKLQQLLTIIEESKQSGRRVLIFSQFTKMLDLIGRELAGKGLPFFYLDGSTPSQERIDLCRRFNEGERDIFLISLKAGGTGLNLHSADTVILFDTWWNPAVEEQAADRAHRMGQKNTVQVIKLVAKGTIEEKMNELQEKKRHLVQELIDSQEKKDTVLTEEDIKEILNL